MKLSLLCALMIAGIVAAHAQTFSIDWFTIDGGGGTSTGGVFSVSGTVGQHDAGAMSGGAFTLQGGFWTGAIAIQTPGAPYLYISNLTSGVIVYWERPATGFVLDQTTTLSPPTWTPVSFPYATNTAHISITVPSPVDRRFYRLRRP